MRPTHEFYQQCSSERIRMCCWLVRKNATKGFPRSRSKSCSEQKAPHHIHETKNLSLVQFSFIEVKSTSLNYIINTEKTSIIIRYFNAKPGQSYLLAHCAVAKMEYNHLKRRRAEMGAETQLLPGKAATYTGCSLSVDSKPRRRNH